VQATTPGCDDQFLRLAVVGGYPAHDGREVVALGEDRSALDDVTAGGMRARQPGDQFTDLVVFHPVSVDQRLYAAAMELERPQIEVPDTPPTYVLEIEDVVAGDGDEATKGSKVTVHYAGAAHSTGEEFDASWNRGAPFIFRLGKGQVIAGWDQGVEGMKVGGRRKLVIPPDLGYGASGAGGVIKPMETLVFVVDLLAVEAD
jgi:peptidylprolyl isomerase